MSEKDVTAFLHARASVAVLGAALVGASWAAVAPDSAAAFPGGIWGFVAAMVSALGAASLMVFYNRAFNILRSLTWLVAGMFLVMLAGTPLLAGEIYSATALLWVVLASIGLLFSVFGDFNGQRPVFLTFALLSAGALIWWGFALYMVVFLLGCIQMRVWGLRTFLAALMGVATPPWIALGFGWISPADLPVPDIAFAWEETWTPGDYPMIACTGFTMLLGLVFTVMNILKILSYNSRIRAFNGFLTLLFLATALFEAVDFGNFTFYVPLLDAMAAYQAAHFFTYRRTRRSYIPILLIVCCYAAFYVWAVA